MNILRTGVHATSPTLNSIPVTEEIDYTEQMMIPFKAVLAGVALAAFTGTAFAQADPAVDPDQVHPKIRARAAQMVKEMDPQGTGRVTKESWIKRMEERWKKMDKDNKGYVTAARAQHNLMFLDNEAGAP